MAGFVSNDEESLPCDIAAKYLYPVLFEKFRNNKKHVNMMEELIKHAVRDRSATMEFLYSLATGTCLTEEDRQYCSRVHQIGSQNI
jgi:hypothetical protein